MSESIDDELDELYRVTLEQFVARRKALATRLKKAGQKSEAERVVALPKPSASAWAVNQLHWLVRGELEALFQTGRELREVTERTLAQSPDPSAIVRAQREQRAHVEALALRAGRALEDQGLGASDAVLARVRTTLTTLSTRGDWGESAPGRLAKDLDPLDVASLAGLLNVAPSPDVRGASPAAVTPRLEATEPADSSNQRESDRAAALAKAAADRALALAEVELAGRRVAQAAAEVLRLEGRVREAVERSTALIARVDELDGALKRARNEATAAAGASEEASAALADARRVAEEAWREHERARVRSEAAK